MIRSIKLDGTPKIILSQQIISPNHENGTFRQFQIQHDQHHFWVLPSRMRHKSMSLTFAFNNLWPVLMTKTQPLLTQIRYSFRGNCISCQSKSVLKNLVTRRERLWLILTIEMSFDFVFGPDSKELLNDLA